MKAIEIDMDSICGPAKIYASSDDKLNTRHQWIKLVLTKIQLC